MKIYHGIEDFVRLECAVVTSGTFDGVHVGHQKILQRLQETALKMGGATVVITFWPHPRLVLNPLDTHLKLLSTFEEKAERLRTYGVQHLLRIPFTKEFSQLSSGEFIRNILVDAIGTSKLVIGYDHHFGKNREGSFEQLKENGPQYGFEVEEIPRQDVDHIGVSSTKIREALEAGDVQTATHLLGRPYSLTGRVIMCDRIGRTLGYPTANLEIDSAHKLVPADGIYAVTVLYDHRVFKGMLYIGNRPTIGGVTRSIEVHLFEFEGDLYGETLTVFLHQKTREDIRFENLDQLKQQLDQDKKDTLQALETIPLWK
ncbi:MAG TPA: bifunctional riboflavin kinase/FAD synthetase [Chryseolinea sp.]|nr:bifunctional riboflavin kinase/FAD synthetase [Chryseolinea sp.]